MSVERRGTKALELWAKRATQGYKGVSVDNMTTSWRDGLAFCALIHHFKPDLIDFGSLKPEDIFENNALAFRVAEQQLGIPALLDAEDMLESPVPDRLSILTYVSQFYQAFASMGLLAQGAKSPAKSPPPKDSTAQPSPVKEAVATTSPAKSAPCVSNSRTAPPSAPSTALKARPISHPPSTLQTKRETEFKTDKVSLGIRGRREECHVCQKPVYLAERILVGSPVHIRHRTCFRCARCSTQLTLANYYETEKGEFCCETCPDEEKPIILAEDTVDKNLSSSESESDTESDSSQSLSSLNKSSLSASLSSFTAEANSPAPIKTKVEATTDPLPRTVFLQKTLSKESFSAPLPTPSDIEQLSSRKEVAHSPDPLRVDSSISISRDDEFAGIPKATEIDTPDPTPSSSLAEAKGKESFPPMQDASSISTSSPLELSSPSTSKLSGNNVEVGVLGLLQEEAPKPTNASPVVEDVEDNLTPTCDINDAITTSTSPSKATFLKAQKGDLLNEGESSLRLGTSALSESKPIRSNIKSPNLDDEAHRKNLSRDIESKDRRSAINILEKRLQEKAATEKSPVNPSIQTKEKDPPFGVVLRKYNKEETSPKEREPKVDAKLKKELFVPTSPKTKPDNKKVELMKTFFSSKVEIKPVSKKDDSFPHVDEEMQDAHEETTTSHKEVKGIETETQKPDHIISEIKNPSIVTENHDLKEESPLIFQDKKLDKPEVKLEPLLIESIANNDSSMESYFEETKIEKLEKPVTELHIEDKVDSPFYPEELNPFDNDDEEGSSQKTAPIIAESTAPTSTKPTPPKAPTNTEPTSTAPTSTEPTPTAPTSTEPTLSKAPTSTEPTLSKAPTSTEPTPLTVLTSIESMPPTAPSNTEPTPTTPTSIESTPPTAPYSIESTAPTSTEPTPPAATTSTEPAPPTSAKPTLPTAPTIVEPTPPPKAPRSFAYSNKEIKAAEEKSEKPNSHHTLQDLPKVEPKEEEKKVRPSLNPFDSEEDEPQKPEPPAPPRKSTNPFWSDDEEPDDTVSTPKAKAKPPPRPPPPNIKRNEPSPTKKLITPSPEALMPPSPTPSNRSSSSETTLRIKKKLKPAPAPPLSLDSYGDEKDEVMSSKMQKDMKNHTSKLISDSSTRPTGFALSKSEAGEWRRKKGPAPPLPIPQKRVIHKLPLRKVQQELQDIEIKQTELERQGVLLETAIRDKTEQRAGLEDASTASSLGFAPEDAERNSQSLTSNSSQGSIEVEDMILQLFELVNEKNELFRRQTELMYIKREKRLEEEHAELEYQIRCLMQKPTSQRTPQDTLLEEDLLARLCKVVDQRDEVINCLELERQREAVENESIASHMIRYQEKYIDGIESSEDSEAKKKKKKKLKLIKRKKKKKDKEKEHSTKVDADKDVDETEVVKQEKRKAKKKHWFKKLENPPT